VFVNYELNSVRLFCYFIYNCLQYIVHHSFSNIELELEPELRVYWDTGIQCFANLDVEFGCWTSAHEETRFNLNLEFM